MRFTGFNYESRENFGQRRRLSLLFGGASRSRIDVMNFAEPLLPPSLSPICNRRDQNSRVRCYTPFRRTRTEL